MTYRYDYTKTGRPKTRYINGKAALRYTYTKAGRIASITDICGKTTAYGYDLNGRLASVSEKGKVLAAYAYDTAGRVKNITFANGMQTLYAYDRDRNLASVETKDADGSILMSYSYQYDRNGNRTEKKDLKNGNATTYLYDSMQRLSEVTYPGTGKETYCYDEAGNRIRKQTQSYVEDYLYDERNRLMQKNSTNPDSSGRDNANITTYQYDLQGSLLKEESADFCKQYLYNDFHQCIQTDVIRGREESAERLVQENLYDGEGLRFAIIENGKRTGFITDGWNNVAEIDENGRVTKRIIRGMGIAASEDTEQKEDNIFTTAYHYYHGNERMDVEYITDEAGNVVNSYTYDAFGGIISSNETIPNRYTYNGEAYDKITEQYYLRKRYYNPKLCRFTQEDEYRGDGLNLYAFCANNPVMYVDPSGYKCETGAEADRDADESATGGNRQASQNDVDEAVQGDSESGTDSIGNIGNPSDNPKVLADAMEDSAAVYGYRPREDGSIKQFANYDWSDPKVVAELREIRLDYLQENRSYQNMVDNMRNAGCSDTEIAQRLVAERNAHRLSYYVDETGKIINEDLYRQAVEHCVSYEDLRKGINGKSPKTDLQIIESAMKSNPGYDACCGLYGH